MSDGQPPFPASRAPHGRIDDQTFELVEEAVPEIGEGEALVRTRWISVDPTNRAWIGETPTYLPPVAIGEVMRAGGLGEVVASNSPDYAVGQLVQGLTRLAGLRRRLGVGPADARCRRSRACRRARSSARSA